MNIPVIFSINKDYLTQVAVVIKSILSHSSATFDFRILSTDLNQDDEDKLKKNVIRQSPDSDLRIINIKSHIRHNLENYMSHRKCYKHISCETYFRFYIPDLFKEYDKVIYLDADILVFDDLTKIFNVNISSHYAAVVKDIWQRYLSTIESRKTETRPNLSFERYFNEVIGVKGENYFNAGILVLNLSKIRKDELTDKFWNFAYKNSPLEFQDQDVLNAVFKGNVYYLETRWNLLKDFQKIYQCSRDLLFKDELASAQKAPGIVHYVGPDKPWKMSINSYPYIEDWWNTFSQTGLLTRKDIIQFRKIKSSNRYRVYTPFFVFKICNFDILHLYRQEYRYYCYFLGIRIFRKTIKL